jgi:C4-type Zn-finger protein
MDSKVYAEALEKYRLKIERMTEMLEASIARERSQQISIDAMGVKIQWLQEKIASVERNSNCR